MSIVSKRLGVIFLLTMPTASSLSAQQQDPAQGDINVYGSALPEAPEMTEGPEIKGIISAHDSNKIQVTIADGTSAIITINDVTQIKTNKGLFGVNRNDFTAESLLNGLPVTIKTLQSGGDLVASRINFRNNDLKTATMIRRGTDQRFDEQAVATGLLREATEALRGRMGDIDKYNIKSTTNVNFDIGTAELSDQAKADLCATATAAEEMDNALMLVVGYTDSTGSDEINQQLSEKRADSAINYLQQACGWKPYRMLTPTGMAKADPLASNDTVEGKAQNRRVSVNVLVSKGLDGL